MHGIFSHARQVQNRESPSVLLSRVGCSSEVEEDSSVAVVVVSHFSWPIRIVA
jgi:hypothetical protein